MQEYSVGEIQRNPAIFSNMTESFRIVDKRRNKPLAVVHPIEQKEFDIMKYAGYFKSDIKVTKEDIEKSKLEHYRKKYGISD